METRGNRDRGNINRRRGRGGTETEEDGAIVQLGETENRDRGNRNKR